MNPQQPQPLASTSQLISTPSTEDGIPRSLENDLRVAGCMMIQEAGIMLNLYVLHLLYWGMETDERPQSTMAIAQVIFHRFYMVSSMTSFGVNVRLASSVSKEVD